MTRLFFLILLATATAYGQGNTAYWQQHVDYRMEVDMDVETYRYTGTQNWYTPIIRPIR